MRARLVLAAPLAATIGLLLVVVSEPIQASAAADGASRSTYPTREVECPIAVPGTIAVECGELVVPEDYERPEGSQLRLPYVILRSRGGDPAPDPLVFTAGGPGYSSLDDVWAFADPPLLDDRDVIVFEQRGNRHAAPALTCDASVWWEEAPGHTPCLDGLRAQGIDLTQYSTDNIVRDVIALRGALGYERWNLYGSSFSTSVMLLVMEADPGGTRSAILESVKPPNETTFAHGADSPLRAIEQVFAGCAADDGCADSYPDLEDDFFSLVRGLNDEPLEMEMESSIGSIPIVMDGDRFIDWIVVGELYGPVVPHHGAAYLPLLVDEVLEGNTRPLEVAAQGVWTSRTENPNWAWGLMLAINCQQDLPAAGPARPPADLAASERLDGFDRSASQRAICEAWDLAPLAPAATDDVRSDVPALVLAGSYDPVTPPEWSRTTAEHLANGTYVEFPARGHNVTSDNTCAALLEARFLADPTRGLDTSCVETTPAPSFVSVDDVYRAPGLARSGDEVSLGDERGVAWLEALMIVSVYGAFLLVVILAVLGVLWLLRIRRRARPVDRTILVAYLLAWLAALAIIGIALLTTQLNDDYENLGDLAFSLGPSRDLTSAVLLAWISPLAGLVMVALAAMTTWAWLTHRWGTGFRIVTTVTTICSLAMAVLAARWGLFTMLV